MKKKIFSTLLLFVIAVASTSMFVSCKDYDDDINANKSDIESLRTELSTVKSSLETELSSTKSELETQITEAKKSLEDAVASKADASVVTELQNKVTKLESDLAALEASLGARIDAANDAIMKLSNETAASFEEANATLVALTGDVENVKAGLEAEKVAREAVEKNLDIQKKALEDYQKATDADIDALNSAIDELKSNVSNLATTASISELKAALEKQMQALSEQVTALNTNLDALTVFTTKLLSSIALVPDLYVDGIETIEFKSLKYTPLEGGSDVYVDNGMTTATYRLNPNNVKQENLDVANISFAAATAQTRVALNNSPVLFNGIKSYENGLMTVYVKKANSAVNFGKTSDGRITIVSLKVPRYNDQKNTTTTDIYSENSRLYETTITPRIAKLAWDTNDAEHHYWDSLKIYSAPIDNPSLTASKVVKSIYYNESFNLNELVTGCYLNEAGNHTRITKDELKTYGLTYRFAIPTTPYNTVTNNTDQQQFASVTPEGVISSKLPNGTTNNRACVGKEPIVRIMLCDTVNHKMVDEKYMKIKWSENVKPEVDLGEYSSDATLSCDNMTAYITWDKLINDIYAKAVPEGMSQKLFEQVYPVSNITGTVTSILSNKTSVALYNVSNPVFNSTTNEHGDAIIGQWVLTPDDVMDVYKNSQNDTKTFVAKITFKSNLSNEYADLTLTWKFTIKLPTLPSLYGYAEGYWYDQFNSHEVLPVQYNTQGAGAYCTYNFPMLSGIFTYNNGSIVKNMTDCGYWDLQFSQNNISGYVPGEVGDEPIKTQGVAFGSFGAYKLQKSGTTALELQWDNNHTSWQGDDKAYLFADHNNPANQGLLNPLSDENKANGTSPKFTYDKKVNMSIWASLNNYNYIPVKKYTVCLIAPLRLNAKLDGYFVDGVVSGSAVDISTALTLTDFRGYYVANGNIGTAELEKYAQALWNYYECEDPVWDLDGAKYGMKMSGGNLVVDDNLTYSNGMTAAQLESATDGTYNLSITKVGNTLVFSNNKGANVNKECNVFIPVTVKYGFGELQKWVKIRIYPNGTKPTQIHRR